MTEPVGDPVAGLVFTTVSDAKRLAESLDPLVKNDTHLTFTLERLYLAKVQFALNAAADLLAKFYEENQQIVDKLETAVKDHNNSPGE
jgi:hypothetical protein